MPRRFVAVLLFCLVFFSFLSLNAVALDELDGSGILVIPDGIHEADLHLNEEVAYVWVLCNQGPDSFHLGMTPVENDTSFQAEASPSYSYLGPNQSDDSCTSVSLIVTAPSSGVVTPESIGLSITATRIGTAEQANETYWTINHLTGITPPADPEGKLYVLFWPYDNPLPAPLDNKYGAFLVSFLIWILIAGLVVLVSKVSARAVRHTETHVDDMIVQMMKGPIFVILVVTGLDISLDILGLPADLQSTLASVFGFLMVILFTWIVYKLFKNVLVYYGGVLSAKTQTDMDDRLIPVISKVGGVIIIILGVIFIVQSFGYDVTLFLAGMGVIGIVIGFAAQDTLSNFFSGIFLMLDRPFQTGDLILLNSGDVCRVSWVGLRSTKLYHLAKHRMIVMPNNMLAEERVDNITMPDARGKSSIMVGVAYGTDLDHAKKVLTEIVLGHPNILKGKGEDPAFRVTEFADSSINLKMIFWVDEVENTWRVESELKEAVDKRFQEEKIEIPFPQQVVYMHSEEKI
ncbi:MAG: mechanosensitive ion channel family protein [Methanobacteriota archaeon]|nr:MAG: mechanosensitive ion channel family protein [Euryarchaeota archaeon]